MKGQRGHCLKILVSEICVTRGQEVRLGTLNRGGTTDETSESRRVSVGWWETLSKDTWLLSAPRHSPQAVTIHQGDFTLCVSVRQRPEIKCSQDLGMG